MKLMLTTLVALLAMPLTSFAHAAPEEVEAIDQARAGELAQAVREFYAQNYGTACEVNEAAKIEVFKLSSASMNETKKEGTPYYYEADYLVTQKCFYASTFQGAYAEIKSAAILKASFKSNYDMNYGPAKMADLEIKFVKSVSLPKTPFK